MCYFLIKKFSLNIVFNGTGKKIRKHSIKQNILYTRANVKGDLTY